MPRISPANLLPLLLLLTQSGSQGQIQNASWPCSRGDTRNTGQGQWRAPVSTFAWTFETLPSAGGGNRIYASPVLSAEGTVYIGNSRFYALDAATGRKKWQFYAEDASFNGSAAIGTDHCLYLGCDDANLYALNADTGKILWQMKMGGAVRSSPTIGADGTLYVGSADKSLYALDSRTGQQKWAFSTEHDVASAPVLGASGLIYCQNWGTLYALGSKDGKPVWTYKAQDDLYTKGNPAVGKDGTLYAAFVLKGPDKDGLGSVVALNGTTGKPLWTTGLPRYIFASPALGANGLLYVGCGDGKLYALDAKTGKITWTFETGIHIQASPAVGIDGTVYIGSYDKSLYAIDGSTGAKKWEFATRGGIQSSPVVSLDGTVFVGSLDGNVYAVCPKDTPAAKNTPPTK